MILKNGISNTLLFNGRITSEFTDVGGGYIAFTMAGGERGEEMPLMLLTGSLDDAEAEFSEGDVITGYGVLGKLQGEWVIYVAELLRVPTDEELEKMKDS